MPKAGWNACASVFSNYAQMINQLLECGKLTNIYCNLQMITLGGDAELELVDSLDPFAEGVVFTVRPPKKSWKSIANLSGGEKVSWLGVSVGGWRAFLLSQCLVPELFKMQNFPLVISKQSCSWDLALNGCELDYDKQYSTARQGSSFLLELHLLQDKLPASYADYASMYRCIHRLLVSVNVYSVVFSGSPSTFQGMCWFAEADKDWQRVVLGRHWVPWLWCLHCITTSPPLSMWWTKLMQLLVGARLKNIIYFFRALDSLPGLHSWDFQRRIECKMTAQKYAPTSFLVTRDIMLNTDCI